MISKTIMALCMVSLSFVVLAVSFSLPSFFTELHTTIFFTFSMILFFTSMVVLLKGKM